MVRFTKPSRGTWKVVVTDIGFCVLVVFISMFERGVFGLELIKKRSYWNKGVTPEEIIWHTQNKEVGDVDAVKGSIRGKNYHILAIKDPNF